MKKVKNSEERTEKLELGGRRSEVRRKNEEVRI